jgi:hypothetical protein
MVAVNWFAEAFRHTDWAVLGAIDVDEGQFGFAAWGKLIADIA